jgi:hypothetical protein
LAWGLRIRKADLVKAGLESLEIDEGTRSAYVTLHLITGGASGNEEKLGAESKQTSTITT